MQPAAADSIAEHEGAPVAHRQRRLTGVVPERHARLRRLQEKLVLQAVTQFVLRVGNRKIARRVTPGSTLDRDNVEPCLRQFVRKNGAGPSEPDDDSVFSGKPARHCLFSLQSIQINRTRARRPLSKTFIVTSLGDWRCRRSATSHAHYDGRSSRGSRSAFLENRSSSMRPRLCCRRKSGRRGNRSACP